MSAASSQERGRFHSLVRMMVDATAAEFVAARHGVTTETVRNWIEEAPDAGGAGAKLTFPSRRIRTKVFADMKITEAVLKLPSQEWEAFADEFSRRCAKLGQEYKNLLLSEPTSAWLYTGGQVSVMEEAADATKHLMLITADARNDTEIAEVRKIVEENVSKGVQYTYVIPATCPNRESLVSMVSEIRSGQSESVPQVHIMVVRVSSENAKDWRFIDHALFFLTQKVENTSPAFKHDVTSRVVETAFEQIYRTNDSPISQNYWIRMPRRRSDLYLNLLREWCDRADWV